MIQMFTRFDTIDTEIISLGIANGGKAIPLTTPDSGYWLVMVEEKQPD